MAIEVFENEDVAINWMRQPNRVLGNVAPLDLMDTEPGATSVRQVLNAIAPVALLEAMAGLWRITSKKWALDTSCEGARLYGGRWNSIGYPVMYAGTTIELCALEKFVHLAGVPAPPLVLVAIDTPDDERMITREHLTDIPRGWSDLPMSTNAQEYGRVWLETASRLMLMVPSTIVPEPSNAVINPAHSAYKKIRLQIVREFSFDTRMWKT